MAFTGACGGNQPLITVDGSSTVFPITEAVAEEFRRFEAARVTVGVSGTRGGFKKFCQGETALSGASRPIQPHEVDRCQTNGIDYIELPLAYDGIAVVVHPSNDWVDSLTVEELREIWSPQVEPSKQRWSDIRPEWPDREFHLFGPGPDSGTYDYFTKAIVGRERVSRADFTASENDHMLVRGVANDADALGFFGLSYYTENRDKLRLVAIDDENPSNGDGPMLPNAQTVADGSYQPLTRPVFLYVSKREASRPEVASFVDFYLERGPSLSAEVGYVPLSVGAYVSVRRRFHQRTGGSMFGGQGSTVGVTVENLIAASTSVPETLAF